MAFIPIGTSCNNITGILPLSMARDGCEEANTMPLKVP